ncbi:MULTISPECIES: hypothetical protein [unclassified Pseudoclavibacter]|uniref:hypothetical protein n=1 Tax=unclassified Pseudoclavibacter TaxID=2615177 RepID=UPI001BADE3D2|nr:hypothetical protein [Pseudoclavibacter sp. Marseille-Q4354]MBS3178367.1 hypothetical protein [Pseudoclavibacter sp. Marseille-Q4354]
MSVRAGRWFLVVAAVAFIAGLAWFALVEAVAGSWAKGSTGGAVLALLGAVALSAGAVLFGRFVEARVEGAGLVIRSVRRRERVIPVDVIDEVVVVERLLLPTRTGPGTAARVILRRRDDTIAAFTPHGLRVVDALLAAGCSVTRISEPLSPMRVRRRYRGGASVGEVLVAGAPAFAIVVAALVLLWALTELLAG